VREIVMVRGVAEVMIGLNDLHLSLGLANPFEVVVSDLMEAAARRVREAGLGFGFGGLARIGDDALPVAPDLVYAQYQRLGADAAWLARSFFAAAGASPGASPGAGPGAALDLAAEVARLRARLAYWAAQSPAALAEMRERLALRLRALAGVDAQ
jgi:hypothetical protein